MSVMQTSTYQEELYQIRTRVLVIVGRPWNEISEDDKALLNKILGSVKLTLAKVDVVTLPSFSPQDLSAYGASRMIAFGATLKSSSKLYENITTDQVQVIVAEDFPLLDDAKKKSLWIALKQMFAI